MGLFELCLISLLSPQEPVTAPPHATAPPAQAGAAIAASPNVPVAGHAGHPEGAQGPQDPPVVRLNAAEVASESTDPADLVALAIGEDPDIAARAAWLNSHNRNWATTGRFETQQDTGSKSSATNGDCHAIHLRPVFSYFNAYSRSTFNCSPGIVRMNKSRSAGNSFAARLFG